MNGVRPATYSEKIGLRTITLERDDVYGPDRPGRAEDANMLAAWREKYANEITERTKKRWWRRLVKKSRPGKARKRAA